jgi:hypothetical protein
MPTWTVETQELAAALKQMRRFARGTPGDAGWLLGDDQLRIEWAGMTMSLPASGDKDVVAQLPAETMMMLVKLPLPELDMLNVAVADDRLMLGSFSVACKQRQSEVPQLLPLEAPPLQVALLPFRHSEQEIDDAGLRDTVRNCDGRKRSSIEKAASALRWLGVEEHHVEAWIEAHLRAVVDGKDSFSLEPRKVVLDRGGQVRLFSNQ